MRRSLLLFSNLLLLAVLPAFAQSPSELIGSIDFYGYGRLDLAALRAALPFQEGDRVPDESVSGGMLQAVAKIAGREPAGRKPEYSSVCCLPDGRRAVFIGLPEVGAPPLAFKPTPHGDARLPADALQIFAQFEKDLFAAVKAGTASEDDSKGFALFQDPATLADQLKILGWTRGHTALVLKVLSESADASHRAYAAQAMGYAERSPEQIAALVSAAFDPDEEVRNNAVRALQVLCALGPEITRQIPAARFIPLLHSLSWTDRNKGAMLFYRVTAGGDPALLKMLHDRALEPLREMAQWKDFSHAWFSLAILGRIGGIEESRLEKMDASMVEEILQAAK